jgi:hypothetical protein
MRLGLAPFQRICVTLVELANSVGIKSRLFDFKTGAAKKLWVKFLNRKPDGFGCGCESPIADWASIET